MIKMYGQLNITSHIDFIILRDVVLLSIGIKYLRHPNDILRIISEATLPFPNGNAEEIIISSIDGKGEFFILLDIMHRLSNIFSSVP